MLMIYHSEKIITNFALKVIRKTGLRITGITPQQVEDGALLAATNSERKAFFAYSALVIAVSQGILTPISALLMILYLSTVGLNLGVVLCTPFWITYFTQNCLDRKVRKCDSSNELVVFSKKDLFICLVKAGLLSTAVIGVIIWIIISQ